MSVRARHSWDKQEQITTTLPIAMDAIKAIANHNGCNQRNHLEAPKCSREMPLKRNKEGHGNQPQSHMAALPTNAMRAL
jgi:hypothetical protein